MTNGMKFTDDRLVKLRNALSASLKADGEPAPGFKQRVDALRAEISRLEAEQCNTGKCGPRGFCGNAETARAEATKDSAESSSAA